MLISLESRNSILHNLDSNIQTMIKALKNAHDQKIDVVCFGEAFLQGSPALSFVPEKDVHLAVKIYSIEMKILMEAAKYYHVALAFGFIEECYRSFYSSYVFIGDQGEIIDMYRSCCTNWRGQADDKRYKQGPGYHVFTYKDKKMISTLGYDLDQEQRLELIATLQYDAVLCPCLSTKQEDTAFLRKIAFQSQSVRLKQPLLVTSTLTQHENVGICALFEHGQIKKSLLSGAEGSLIIEI